MESFQNRREMMSNFSNSTNQVNQLRIKSKKRNMRTYVVTENEFNYLTNLGNEYKLANKVLNGCITAFITLGLPALIEHPTTATACGVVYVGIIVSLLLGCIAFIHCKKVNDGITSITQNIKDEST